MSGPLANLKILDFTTLLPGPYGTMMLADMGAEVLRVEAPGRFDLLRAMQPKDHKTSYAHRALNRSKKSIAVDLKDPSGKDKILKLVDSYDIVIEGFRPGVMERLGLSYEQLQQVKPNIIYASITGYGQTGPFKDRPGHDINYQAIAGIASYNGRRESGPCPTAFQIADIAGGSCHLVMGLLAAVIHRMETGEGQAIDISMTDATFAMNAMFGAATIATDLAPEREALPLNGGTFYDFYTTKDGRHMSVGSLEPAFLTKLLGALNHPELLPKGFSDKPEDQRELKHILAKTFKTKTLKEWQSIFDSQDACVEPVLSLPEACDHPQIRSREMIVEVDCLDGPPIKQAAFPIKFSKSEPTYRHAGVDAGHHNEEFP